MRRTSEFSLIVCVAMAVLLGTRGGPTAQTPAAVYTAPQAAAGKAHYATTCAACHGADLGGADAPALAGVDFAKAWSTQTTADLFKYVQGMPPGSTPLPDGDNLTVVAFILQQNGAAAGTTPLEPTTAVTIGAIATGTRPPIAAAVSHRR